MEHSRDQIEFTQVEAMCDPRTRGHDKGYGHAQRKRVLEGIDIF